MIKLSTSKELEGLRNKRAGLEEESNSLKGEQQNREERVKVLEERIAIEELENGNKATRKTISQVESKIDELEKRLKEIKLPEASSPDEIKPEIITSPEPSEDAAQGITGTVVEETEGDDVVTVMPPESSLAPGREEPGENLKTQHEKKKRRFF